MPGLSLWLIPDDNNPFTKTAQELISDTVPRQFTLSKQHDFQPHVTVTPDIDSETLNNKTPQEWLNDLPLPEFKKEHNEVKLELDHLEAEDPFFRKLNIAVEQNSNLTLLVTACRKAAGLEEFKEGEYRPHLSLLYADTPTGEVKNKVPLIEMKIGFAFGDLFACCGGALCMGGSLVLVDTRQPIDEWKHSILATRATPWVTWRATRNLL